MTLGFINTWIRKSESVSTQFLCLILTQDEDRIKGCSSQMYKTSIKGFDYRRNLKSPSAVMVAGPFTTVPT